MATTDMVQLLDEMCPGCILNDHYTNDAASWAKGRTIIYGLITVSVESILAFSTALRIIP